MNAKTKAKPRKKTSARPLASARLPQAYTALSFAAANRAARGWADLIESKLEAITEILLQYESYEVVQDEIGRTLDHLRNLAENREYFKLRVGPVTTFLPRNQPLYAFTCFVVVPSLMANEVHFRIPHSMRAFFPKLLETLEVANRFPNVKVSAKERSEFLRERSSLYIDPETLESRPATDVVIFTGLPVHADQLRFIFDDRTLFIANGAGHNPVVISHDADLSKAVDAVLTLQLYNQGQDCAAPNAVLVHQDAHDTFMRILHDRLRLVRVGQYRDRGCRVGPISDPKDLVRIQDFLIENRAWLDPLAPGVLHSREAILEPTIVLKPLAEGGNYGEIFAPVIFVQEYEKDASLAEYFENPQYAKNAMYVTYYGTSPYVAGLAGKAFDGKVLHDRVSIHHDTHLHAQGVERGTHPYGGNGIGASSLSIKGKVIAKATLPQRDIYEWVAKPLLVRDAWKKRRTELSRFTVRDEKNIEKLLRMKTPSESARDAAPAAQTAYIDLNAVPKGKRYAEVGDEIVYRLLDAPNTKYIGSLKPDDLRLIRAVQALLARRADIPLDEFTTWLYAIAKESHTDEEENRARQLRFFGHLYQLLLGKKSGPRLASFLLEIDRKKACQLLDV